CVLSAVYVAALVAIISMPDLVARRQGWVGSLRPRVAVAAPARRAVATMTPVLGAGVAAGGRCPALGRVRGWGVRWALPGARTVPDDFAARHQRPGAGCPRDCCLARRRDAFGVAGS